MQTTETRKMSLLRRILLRFNISLPYLPSSPPSHQTSFNTLLQLAALVGIAVIFHFFIASYLIATLAAIIFLTKLAFLFKSQRSLKRNSHPPQLITIFLTIVSVGLIIFMYGGWNGQRSGISFLVLLASLKFLESKNLRDHYVVCLILYFLAASSFLFKSSIINIIIVILYTLAVTAVMLQLSSPSKIAWRSSTSSASGIITKALPIALILFFFFPRVHGNFGFLPSYDSSQFENQVSDSLVGGDIASSAFNNSLAFRVEFEGEIPSSNQLYWRSKVMSFEDNFAWVINRPSLKSTNNAKVKRENLRENTNQNSLTRYTVLHEKSADIFLPYLDYVADFSRGRLNDDLSIWSRGRSGTFSYKGGSRVTTSIKETSQVDIEKLLQYKSRPSAKTQALLAQWKKHANDPTSLAQHVLDHFTNNEFYYSLYPPGLGDFPVDEFLFNTKTGYCEHYASLFTLIMRWLGVPSRVVVGYQGGKINQSGQYLEVRYSDAHAWSEILVDQTWVRVDPTAAISPERIEFGMDAFMTLWDAAGTEDIASLSLSNYLNPKGVDRYYRILRDSWNNVGYQWKKWVIDYDSDTQQELLQKLGLNASNHYGVLVLIIFTSIGSILLFYFWRMLPKPIKRSPEQQLYLKFVGQFKRANIIKNPADTPLEFAQKAIRQFPNQQDEILKLTDTYINIRYGRSPDELQKFKRLVKQFKLIQN